MKRETFARTLRWPVFDDPFLGKKPIAWCSDYYQAVEMVNANLGKTELYIGEPRYADEVSLVDIHRTEKGIWL